MKKIIISLLLIVASVKSFGQTLGGRIIIKDSNKPLPNVSIIIVELQRGTITNDNGIFSFDNTGKGTIHLQASLIGYRSVVKTIDLVKHANDVVISMETSSNELEEVVVTSNNSDLKNNIPYSVSAYSLQDLHKTSQPTLMQMLAEQPGIDRISEGNGIGKPVIRGLSYNRIMLYAMGTRIENQLWDDDHDLGITEAGLDKVEVVYGPAALIYGADALGGALIFTDEKPPSNGSTVGSIYLSMFSNTLGINGDIGIKGSNNKGFFYILHAGGQSHADYIQGGKAPATSGGDDDENVAPNSRFENYSGKAVVGMSRKWGMSKLSYNYLHALTGMIEDDLDDKENTNMKGDDDDRGREIEAPYQDVSTHVLSSENIFLLGTSKLNINAAWQYNNRREFEDEGDDSISGTPGLDIGLKLNTWTYDLKWTSDPMKKYGIVFGSQGMYQLNRNFGGRARVPDANICDYAGYALFRFDPNTHWNLLAGLRYDTRQIKVLRTVVNEDAGNRAIDSLAVAKGLEKPDSVFNRKYKPVSFSVGVAFHPTEYITVKANIASGFSAPNYAELSSFGIHEGSYRFEVGDSKLRMEQNAEADAGITGDWKNASIALSGFYNMIKDFIYVNPNGDSINALQVYNYVQHDAVIAGGSAEVTIHPIRFKWVQLTSSYSVTRGIISEGNLPFMPADKVITTVRLQKEKVWKLNKAYVAIRMDNHFAQNRVASYETTTAGYNLFDANLGADFKWKKQTLTISLFCTNIFNTAYINNLSLVKFINIHDMGRNYGVQLHIPFGIK